MIPSGPRLCAALFNCGPEEGCGVATARRENAAAADGSHTEVSAEEIQLHLFTVTSGE